MDSVMVVVGAALSNSCAGDSKDREESGQVLRFEPDG
jgi:hypothetical protein